MPGTLPDTSLELRSRSVSTVTATEEGRAFFQARLSIFGLCLAVLAGGSWSVLALLFVSLPDARIDAHGPFSTGGLLHAANAVLAALLWLSTRTGRRTGRLLHGLDLAVSLGLCLVWMLLAATLPGSVGAFVALLAFTLGTLARAIVVPSTARATLWIGLAGASLLVAAAFVRSPAELSLGPAAATACWAGSAICIATLASHTIFGLRREVQQTRVLGQYTLENKIGEGGMGSVWRASHALLRRPTAIKLLPPRQLGDAAIARFEREVQLTARLTHPNTVAIYDYGRTRDGFFYYAMELLEGIDLARLVAEDGAQPAGRVVHVLTQICGALAEAHDLGLVHRDVKPANVLIAPRRHEHEFAKIVDFGLVKSIEASSEQAALTNTNTITGTPLYMSPEAIRSPEAVDPRSDLYALGAVAWFLLVGRPPFEGRNIIEVCSQHLHAPARRPSDVLGRSVPSDLEDLVLGCLAKRPEDRVADARTLRAALEACSAARSWTAAQAGEWWDARAAHPAPKHEPVAEGRSIALDVTTRAQRIAS